jgi:hypothetical protein
MAVEISIVKPVTLPNDILIYINNESGNIIIVKRIILKVKHDPGSPIIEAWYYLRKDDFYVGEEVEEIQRLIFSSANSVCSGEFFGVIRAECTGEYIEVRKRVNSEVYHY